MSMHGSGKSCTARLDQDSVSRMPLTEEARVEDRALCVREMSSLTRCTSFRTAQPLHHPHERKNRTDLGCRHAHATLP